MTHGNEQQEKTPESETTPKKGMRKSIIKALKTLLGCSKLYSLNETDLSIAQYETILRANPKDKDAWMNLGRTYQKKF